MAIADGNEGAVRKALGTIATKAPQLRLELLRMLTNQTTILSCHHDIQGTREVRVLSPGNRRPVVSGVCSVG
jgi:hypothetical protein